MALDQTANFKKVTVSTGYDAAAVSVALDTDEGAKLPDPSGDNYNLVWWDSSTYANPSDDPNVEVVRLTAKSTDTLTVTRNQESSGASTKNTGGSTYKMALALTSKMIDDIETEIATKISIGSINQGDVLYDNGSAISRLTPGTDGQVLTSAGAGANPTWETTAETRNIESAAGDVLVNSIDTIMPNSAGRPLNNTREISVQADGEYRIKFDLSSANGTARIYRNTVAVGTLRQQSGGTTTWSEDISGWSAGDLVQLYVADTPENVTRASNFRVYTDLWQLGTSVATNYTE